MRLRLFCFFLLFACASCCFAQLQFSGLIKVNQCDASILAPNSTLDIGEFQVGASVSAGICVINTGTSTLNLTAITLTSAAGDFTTGANVLPASILPSASSPWAAGFSFAPTTTGITTAQVAFTDDASGSPQTFTLKGTGFTDFGLNSQFTFSNSQTVTAGQTATYLISISGATSPPAPAFFTGVVGLSCAGLPPGASCSISPSTINLQSGNEFAPINVNVNTTARPAASLRPDGQRLWWSLAAVLALAVAASRKRPMAVALIACFLLMGLVISCGGNAASPPSSSNPTPAGTFSIVLNASANGVVHSKNLVLVVK